MTISKVVKISWIMLEESIPKKYLNVSKYPNVYLSSLKKF